MAAPISRKALFGFKEKLKFLRNKLRSWNVEVFGFLDLQEEEALREFNSLDFVSVGTNPVDIDKLSLDMRLASNKVWEVTQNKESILRQKARSFWLKEGDANMRFFHKAMKNRFIRNTVMGLNGESGCMEDVALIKDDIRNHFVRRFLESSSARPILDGVNLACLPQEDF